MKVIAINGSPRKGGNVSQCLDVMAAEFAKEGIEFEVLQPGQHIESAYTNAAPLPSATSRVFLAGQC